jgi:acyl-CoA synthetase (AMP-forming)/AMP-acid ligase II
MASLLHNQGLCTTSHWPENLFCQGSRWQVSSDGRDPVAVDAQGNFRFIDRLKDMIRRRGENTSSHEVEQVLLSHPDIEAAAATPSPPTSPRTRSWLPSPSAPPRHWTQSR